MDPHVPPGPPHAIGTPVWHWDTNVPLGGTPVCHWDTQVPSDFNETLTRLRDPHVPLGHHQDIGMDLYMSLGHPHAIFHWDSHVPVGHQCATGTPMCHQATHVHWDPHVPLGHQHDIGMGTSMPLGPHVPSGHPHPITLQWDPHVPLGHQHDTGMGSHVPLGHQHNFGTPR